MVQAKTSRRKVTTGLASVIASGIHLVEKTRKASAQTPAASPQTDAGAWSFPDARGGTLTLPQRPTRVVAQARLAMALHDYGFDVVGTFLVSHETNDIQFR
ncbi:MAG: hypothetical protein QM589_15010 [Thermomicrobiales bacterium]